MNGTHQPLVYADGSILGGGILTVKGNTEGSHY